MVGDGAAGRKHPRRLRRHESNEIARRASLAGGASFRSPANFAAKTGRPEGANQRRPSAPINANPRPPPPTIALTDRVADRRPTDALVGFIKSPNRPFGRTSQLPSSRPAVEVLHGGGSRGEKGPSQPMRDHAPSCTPNMYISTSLVLASSKQRRTDGRMRLFLVYAVFFVVSISAEEPTFQTTDANFDVAERGTLELPCRVSNLGEYAVLWKRGGNSDDAWTLVIRDVEPYDSSEYLCELTTDPTMSIRHVVQVLVASFVSIQPDQDPLVVGPNETVQLACIPSGNPKPTVSWERVGATLPNGQQTFGGGQLSLVNVQTSHAGTYRCTATNGVKPDAVSDIRLQVHFKPWVQATTKYMPAKVGADINITCIYDAVPPPQVTWIFNSFTINLAEDSARNMVQFNARQTNFTETILAISNIQQENFGDYTCRIGNNIGTKESTIHVSGKPGPPTISASPPNVLQPTLRWTVLSADPIIEYKIRYRLVAEDGWIDLPPMRASKTDQSRAPNEWHHSEVLRSLMPNSEYEIQVQARNAYGWGSYARDYFVYQTGDDASPATVDNSDASPAPGETKGALVAVASVLPLLLSAAVLTVCRRI
uniref:Uncharacterized protein n=1 Tax=Plectus sambesii TaxID=2011161 RepID=A0A914UYY4_9BILA